jgi:HemY protein
MSWSSCRPGALELSLNLFVVLAVGGFLLGHALLRLVSHTLRLPQAVRAFRERKRREKAERALREAVQQLFEGATATP